MDLIGFMSHIFIENAPVIICCGFGGMVRMLRNHSKLNRELRIGDSLTMLLTSIFVGATCYPLLKKYVPGTENTTILLAIGYLAQDLIDKIMGAFSKKIEKIIEGDGNGRGSKNIDPNT